MTGPVGDDAPWVAWAPPLVPPADPGQGMPYAVAEDIADQWWDVDPHMCAALQWEWYAATLTPTPSLSSVNTGAQAMSFSPPMPSGEYGAALARAAWHRSLTGGLLSVPLTVEHDRLGSDPLLWVDP